MINGRGKTAVIFDKEQLNGFMDVRDIKVATTCGEPVDVEIRGYMDAHPSYEKLREIAVQLSNFLVKELVPAAAQRKLEEKKAEAADRKAGGSLRPTDVIYNFPATIVLWDDGTKTVVKCSEEDEFDAMKGLALCYMKKALGNTSRALNDALRWGEPDIGEEEEEKGETVECSCGL